jgi:hypothetical protein
MISDTLGEDSVQVCGTSDSIERSSKIKQFLERGAGGVRPLVRRRSGASIEGLTLAPLHEHRAPSDDGGFTRQRNDRITVIAHTRSASSEVGSGLCFSEA